VAVTLGVKTLRGADEFVNRWDSAVVSPCCGRRHFGNTDEGERLLLGAATKQRLVRT
jgi:hypothetical protein